MLVILYEQAPHKQKKREYDGIRAIVYPRSDVPRGDCSYQYLKSLIPKTKTKRLIGPDGTIQSGEMLVGILEIDPGAGQTPNQGAAQEVYCVLEG